MYKQLRSANHASAKARPRLRHFAELDAHNWLRWRAPTRFDRQLSLRSADPVRKHDAGSGYGGKRG
jgi:hypothetical protein